MIFLYTLFGLLFLFLIYVLFLVRPCNTHKIDNLLKCDYAHRGMHGEGIPENSLAAFSRAVEHGFGIELDVQLSADGVVMVFHDYNLKRMTGCNKLLSDLTYEELRKLFLNGGNEKIPTLSEVLELVCGRVPILIELKGEKTDVSLCPKVDDIMSGYNGAYCIESFNPLLTAWYARNKKDVYRGILISNICKNKNFSLTSFLLNLMVLNCLARPNFISYDGRYKKMLSVRLSVGLFKADRFVWTARNKDEYFILKKEKACVIFEGCIPEKE